MEIKAVLKKPYTEIQKSNFIVENNHILGYEIKETLEEIQAWGETDQEKLQQAKTFKYEEANEKANLFLNTQALYELNQNFHVETTKENMNTLSSAAVAIEKGFIEYQIWTSKEDNVLNLTAEQCLQIAFGIGAIQGDVWCRQFINYKNAINNALTIQDVEAITIDYEVQNADI